MIFLIINLTTDGFFNVFESTTFNPNKTLPKLAQLNTQSLNKGKKAQITILKTTPYNDIMSILGYKKYLISKFGPKVIKKEPIKIIIIQSIKNAKNLFTVFFTFIHSFLQLFEIDLYPKNNVHTLKGFDHAWCSSQSV